MSGHEDGRPSEEMDRLSDVSQIISEVAGPFADIDLPPGFAVLLSRQSEIPMLLLHALRTSQNQEADLLELFSVARNDADQRRRRRLYEDEEDYGLSADSIELSEPAVTLEIEDIDTLASKLATRSSSTKLSQAARPNTLHFGRDYKPYEHKGVESIGITVATNPTTGQSFATLQMLIHPETPIGDGDVSIIGSLLKIRSVQESVFKYTFPGAQKQEYRLRDSKGKGVVYRFLDGSQVVIELHGNQLTMTHAIKQVEEASHAGEEEVDEEKKKAEDDAFQLELKKSVLSQLDFVSRQFPAFTEHIARLWAQRLPNQKLTSQLKLNSEDLGLGDLFGEGESHLGDVPEIVTDDRQRALYRDIAKENPSVTFSMIGGLEDAVKRMQRAVLKAMNPERYEAVGLDPRATVLLIGPPGTGKTMLAEAVAHEVEGTFLSVKGSDIMSMWAGEAEKNVAAVFELVEVLTKERKVVLFIDEIEAVAPSRAGQHMMEYERKITAEFLAALNKQYPNAIIIGATNSPRNVDQAVTRPGRFTDIIAIENPSMEGRKQILSNWIDYYASRASVKVFEGVDLDKLAESTEGLNGADLRTIIEAAIIDEVEDALDEERSFMALGTAALLGHIETHTSATNQRYESYLASPDGFDIGRPIVLVAREQ